MPTFTWIPNYNAKKKPKSKVTKAQYGDGYSQRQPEGMNSQSQDWSLTFENKSPSVATAIDDFLTARGGSESFDWTPPGGAAGKYVCESGNWSKTHVKGNLYTITAEFTQVFEP